MRRLEARGLVDRGLDEWCFVWRVIVTRNGERLLQEVRPVLTEIARAEALELPLPDPSALRSPGR